MKQVKLYLNPIFSRPPLALVVSGRQMSLDGFVAEKIRHIVPNVWLGMLQNER